MVDREKVIKGMEHCIGDNCSGDKWYECEYSGHGCIDALLEDAIALLKAQEPRVMTLEEVAQHNVDKLRRRYPEGFSADRSLHREVNGDA